MSADQSTPIPEEFRPVPGFPNHRVSNFGRVQRKKTPGKKWPDPDNFVWRDCIDGVAGDGYRAVRLTHNGRCVARYVHRLILEAFVCPCPPGMECRHLDGNRTNNRLDNLAWGTPCQNTGDKRRHGTVKRGEGIGTAKLTVGDIEEMRRMRAAGVPRGEIAERFGVQPTQVSRVVLGSNWQHIAPANREAERRLGFVRGSRCHASKLTEADAAAILAERPKGRRVDELAELYGVRTATLYRLLRGKTWTHLPRSA